MGRRSGAAVGTGSARRGELAAVGETARAVLRRPGPERDTVVQSLKAAGAALAAWALAGWWLKAPMALMAPWTALALVDTTVYRSLRAALQQLAVIVLGCLGASAALAATGGSTLGAMALVLPPLLLIGTYRRLGTQGIYGATTALLVITYSSDSPAQIGHRLLETALGAVVGIATNALILPPVHLRSARDQLLSLPQSAARLLRTLSDGLRGQWTARDAESWHERARAMETLLVSARQARERAVESSRLNPARRLRRSRASWTPRAPDARWSAVTDHLGALTRTLAMIARRDIPLEPPGERFFHAYADLAQSLAEVCETEYEELAWYGPTASDPSGDDERVTRAREAYDTVGDAFRVLTGTASVAAAELLLETRQLLGVLTGGGGARETPHGPASPASD